MPSQPLSRSPDHTSHKREDEQSGLPPLSRNEEGSNVASTQSEDEDGSGCSLTEPQSRPSPISPSSQSLLSSEHIPISPSSPGMNDFTSDPLPNTDGNNKQGPLEKPIPQESFSTEDDKVHRVRMEPERTGWARIYDLVREFDKDRITDNKEDIDTLLVFAGLFSAVVTAFIIESYKNLQQQPEDLTNQILMQLAIQMSHLSINGNFVNSTIPDFTSSYQKSRAVVVINTLWTLSLLIALITTSLGILVKQWFHELLSYETHDPMERLKLRFFREAGVERWKVFAIASSLPLLLQLALLLFLIGLVLFLHQLDTIVAWFATGTVIVWLSFILFTTLAPIFSAQCQYKTPFLKPVISGLRRKLTLWPKNLSYRLRLNTSHQRFPTLWGWSDSLFDWFRRVQKDWEAVEEESICKDSSLSLPVVSYALDLLQGERLRDAIIECTRDISIDDMKKTSRQIGKRSSPTNRYILPNSSYGPAGAVGLFTLEAAQDAHLRSIYFGQRTNLPLFATLYFGLVHFQSEAYSPGNSIIPYRSLPSFVHLFHENSTAAAFSILTMYSIRHRTLTLHPNSFNHIFQRLSDSQKRSHGIGDQFVFNILTATKLLVHSIWDQPQDDSGGRNINECVKAIRDDADLVDPVCSPDPVAFIYIIAWVMHDLIPEDVIRRHEDDISEAMGGLVQIITDLDGSAWSHSRGECVGWIYHCLQSLHLEHGHLASKLRALGHTLSLSPLLNSLGVDFQLWPPLYSC